MNAIITAWVLDGEGGGTEVCDPEDFPGAEDGRFLWTHLNILEPGAEDVARAAVPDIPALALEALFALESRPRVEAFKEGALVNLRGVNLNPGGDPEDLIAIRMWVGNNRVVSVRRRKLMTVQDIRDALASPDHIGPKSVGEFVTHLAGGLTMRLEDALEEAEDRLDEVEDEDAPGPEHAAAANEARRFCIVLRRYVAPQRNALVKLAALPVDWLDDNDRDHLRQVVDEVSRHLENMDLIRDRAAIVKDRAAQQAAEKMNRTVYFLTLVAGLFLPLGFVTGLLGINVGGMPGVDDPRAFWVVTGGLVLLAAVQWAIFKIRKF